MTNALRNQKILEAIARETKLATATPRSARAMLIGEGIYTKKGKLKVEFGGERKAKAVA